MPRRANPRRAQETCSRWRPQCAAVKPLLRGCTYLVRGFARAGAPGTGQRAWRGADHGVRRVRGERERDGRTNPVRYFGRQVRKERLAAEWTLAEFGPRTGYDPGHVSRIESGKRPASEVFAQMCDKAFPHRQGWFTEFYEESRTWIATPPWCRNYVSHEQRAATLRNWFPSLLDGLLQTDSLGNHQRHGDPIWLL